MKKSFIQILFLILLLTITPLLSNDTKIPNIKFIYKDKIIPFKENPIITDKEIYFSQEDFSILMKFVGFVDWNLAIENKECTVTSYDIPKFKKKFTPLVYEDKIYIPFSSVNNDIGLSAIFDYDKGNIYLYPQIKDISISEDSLVINGSKEIKIEKNFYLNDPLRFVVDIKDYTLSPDVFRQRILSSHEYIYQVRVSQFNEMPAIVRIVIELKKSQKVKSLARVLPNQVQLIFSDRIPDLYAKPKSDSYTYTNEESTKIYQITPYISGNNVSITLNIDKSVNYSISKLNDGRWYIDLYNSYLTVSANQIELTSDIVKNIKYSQHQKKPYPITRIVITPQEKSKINVSLDSISQNGQLAIFSITRKQEETILDDQNYYSQNNKGKIIVIDPGHGGNDSGATNYKLGIKEKNITLQISLLLEEELKSMGYNVIMTRRGDYEVTGSPIDTEELQARVNVAKKNNAIIFVSVHINASTYSFANGVMTFYCKEIDYPLAQYIHYELAKTGIFDDKGIRQANFYVLKYNKIPAVLLELGFISNYNDATKLMNPNNLKSLAKAIAKGIYNYTKNLPYND